MTRRFTSASSACIVITVAALTLFVVSLFSGRFLEETYALNQTTNWNFAASTNWTAVNGTATDVCGANTQTSGTSFPTLAWTSSLGNPSPAWRAVSGTANSTNYRGEITQTFIAPGSGSVFVEGSMDYYGNASRWSATANSSWVRVDLYDSSNSTFIANLGCASFNANQSWTSLPLGTTATITGGTTYTIRISFRALTRSSSAAAITLAIDNIEVNTAPTGLGASAINGTTTASLSWATSTAGSGAAALNAYRVYRGSSSTSLAFLATATANSYSDASVTGNTAYWYGVTDVDANNVESPTSTAVSLLTIPDIPGAPTFFNVATSTISVSWTPPVGDAPAYFVSRATGATPGPFSQVATVTTSTLNDSALTASTTYWYKVQGNNTTGTGGFSGQTATTTQPLTMVSCSVSATSTSFGSIDANAVHASSPNITATSSCADPLGCVLQISDAGNGSLPGLYKSASPTYLIASANATLTAGVEGYGIQAATTTAGSGVLLTLNSAYAVSGNSVGGLSTSATTLASSASSYTTREVVVATKVSLANTTYAGSYADTVTYSCTGN